MIAFKDAKILEVGGGSGYNTLAFFYFGAKIIDIVEPNQNGVKEMKTLFEDIVSNFKTDVSIYNEIIEDFKFKDKYDFIIDFIIAEGFLHSVDNSKEIISNLLNQLNDGGVLVITCMDYCSMFIEQMKRLISRIIISNIEDYDEKVKKCVELFENTMKNLKNMSRSVEDWVKDDILNPAFNNDVILTIEDVINIINEDYYILGTSQNIFTDLSWYKDIDNFEYLKNTYINQYLQKRHNFIMYGQEESVISTEKSKLIYSILANIRNFSKLYENSNNNIYIDNITKELKRLLLEYEKINNNIYLFIEKMIIYLDEFLKNGKILNYKDIFLKGDVGRTQQYISIQKKYTF